MKLFANEMSTLRYQLIHYPPVMFFVVSFLICLCTFVAFIANTIDQDQTTPSKNEEDPIKNGGAQKIFLIISLWKLSVAM